ncbi:MAG: cysteine methyltransferase [Pedosphaera sp.]|nr:cysteine methyltransferase [Pedosphaera sp.]
MTSYTIIKTPLGDLLLVANESKLIGLYFDACDHVPAARKTWNANPQHPILREAEKQLREFFDGKRSGFSLPLHFAGTDFQERVWREIARVPYGKTISYSELADKAGAPLAIRAAGTNTGLNPISIIIPCHRVVGKNGGMGGYAGGLERKRHLLELENSTIGLMKK